LLTPRGAGAVARQSKPLAGRSDIGALGDHGKTFSADNTEAPSSRG